MQNHKVIWPAAPFIHGGASLPRLMWRVILALLPAVAVYAYFYGIGFILNLLLASLIAVSAEALVLRIRGKKVRKTILDGSAVLTAWLLMLSLPPLSSWWVIAIGIVFAIVVVKHLYGGLGQNIFNPAMMGFVVLVIAFPLQLSTWLLPEVWGLDAVGMATPLDFMKQGLLYKAEAVPEILQGMLWYQQDISRWSHLALGMAYALGGLWLWFSRVITWHLPLVFLGCFSVLAWGFHIWDPQAYLPWWVHLLSPSVMLAAWFIVTDPVSGASTPWGRVWFAILVAMLSYIIRRWGAYPDGIAFAVVLANIMVPLIDRWTQPAVFGRK